MNESSLSQNKTGEDVVEYWALSLMVLPVVTVFGNVLVCLSVYTDRNLHTVTNYFIVSLAIADILVGILVMPLAVYVEVSKKAVSHFSSVRVVSAVLRQRDFVIGSLRFIRALGLCVGRRCN